MSISAERSKPTFEKPQINQMRAPADSMPEISSGRRRINSHRKKVSSTPIEDAIVHHDLPGSTVIFVGGFLGTQREVRIEPVTHDAPVPRSGRSKKRESKPTQPENISTSAAADILARTALAQDEIPRTVIIPSEEAQLVASAKAGDEAAFTALVEETQADVYTLAYRITGNEDDARDVAQEAYLRAFRSLKRFRGDARFSTWMYRITANAASTALTHRTKNRHDELPDDDNVLDERPESDPESMAEAGVLRDKVTAALASLPPLQRTVVVLRDVYDQTHPEIAIELNITEGASRKRLFDARRQLRETLFPMPG